MKTQFSIISYFDPYGDKKSNRKPFKRENYQSILSEQEIKRKINDYNSCLSDNYYNGISFATFDKRVKTINNFDKYYNL